MLEYVQQVFKLNEKQKDGSSLRDHLKRVEEVSGQYFPELHVEPGLLGYVLDIFNEVGMGRQTGGLGAGNLTYTDLEAWCRLTNTHLEPFEIRVIMRIDEIFMTRNS